MTAHETLAAGLLSLGFAENPQAVQNLMQFCDVLLEKNKVMNLTGAADENEVVSRHFLDCAAAFAPLDLCGKTVADVGCGAGFPGMPLALLCPQARVTLLDSLGKRIAFLQACILRQNIENAVAVHARAEEFAGQHREQFDVAISRAVADLRVLAELCLPLVRVGGVFVAMKSVGSDAEIESAANAFETLGAAPPTVRDYKIPGLEISQRVVVLQKIRATPAKYPRRFARIAGQPL